MWKSMSHRRWLLAAALGTTGLLAVTVAAQTEKKRPPKMMEKMGNPKLPKQTYMVVQVEESLDAIPANDRKAKPGLMDRQQRLLEARYDLADKPSDVKMSVGRKSVQEGVRVKLPKGVTWDELASMSPKEIKRKDLFPMGFRPLPHPQHVTGGQVFPKVQIDAMARLEKRDLKRFDIDFDLPDHPNLIS